ncbi:hypothetical protein MXB_4950, partial [Myxobolus squamalis]
IVDINDHSKNVVIVTDNENVSSILLKKFHSWITSLPGFQTVLFLSDPFERFRDLFPLSCSMDDFQSVFTQFSFKEHKNSPYTPIEFSDNNFKFSRPINSDNDKPKSFENSKIHSYYNRFDFNSGFPTSMDEIESHSISENIMNESNSHMTQKFENSDYFHSPELQESREFVGKVTDKQENFSARFFNEKPSILPQASPQKLFDCIETHGKSFVPINIQPPSKLNQNIYSKLSDSVNDLERNHQPEENDYCDMTDSIFEKNDFSPSNNQKIAIENEYDHKTDRNVYYNSNIPISHKHLSSDYESKSANENIVQFLNGFPMSPTKKPNSESLIELGVFQQNEKSISNTTDTDALNLLKPSNYSETISTNNQLGPTFNRYMIFYYIKRCEPSSLSIRDDTYFDRSTKPEPQECLDRPHIGYRRDSPPFRRDIEQPFIVGLQNSSLICYMNSVIQSLISVGVFRNWLEKAYNTFEKLLPDISYVETLYWYQTEIISGKYNYLSSSKLENIVFKTIPHFSQGQQQDAHEFLILLISCLEDEIKLVDIINFTQIQKEYANNLRTTSNEKFNHITIPLSGDNDNLPDGEEIDSCLMRHFAPESIPISYEWKCEKCACVREATKTQLINRLPNLYSKTGRKIQSLVQFPIDKLQYCFPFFSESENIKRFPPEYVLLSVINHHGLTLTSGHYTASCRRPVPDYDNSSWFIYDDR